MGTNEIWYVLIPDFSLRHFPNGVTHFISHRVSADDVTLWYVVVSTQ